MWPQLRLGRYDDEDRLKSNYEQRHAEQLKQWVAGNSIHNVVDDECCPDFSCCRPEFRAPDDVRQRYLAATSKEREQLLMQFLEKLAKAQDLKVVVLGANASEGPCQECGAENKELRPYGRGGKSICFDCGQKNPAETERQIAKLFT